MNNQFDWTLVRSFLAALDHGSLLGAARATLVSQPTIGRHIAELEVQLGIVLFERTGRGLLPTDAALRLSEAARVMENGANQLIRSVSAQDSIASGTVRITASQIMASALLPPVLTQMRLVLPNIQIELLASDAVSNLLRREADIALRMARPDQNTLVAKRIGEVTLSTYAHHDYLRKRGVPKHPHDLIAHELIGYDLNDNIIKGFSAFGITVQKEDFAFRTDDSMAYWGDVQAGFGIGFLPEYLARSDSQIVSLLPALKFHLCLFGLQFTARFVQANVFVRHTISWRRLCLKLFRLEIIRKSYMPKLVGCLSSCIAAVCLIANQLRTLQL